MILISGVISSVFLSPLVFIIPLGAGVILLILRRRTAGAWLIGATTAVLLVLSLPVVGNLALRPLEGKWAPLPADPPAVDALVVLGGGIRQGAAEASGGLDLTDDSRARVVYAAILYRRLRVPVIISGGTTWAERFGRSEADVAAATLIALGVPGEMVMQEGKSRTTRENAREVAAILRIRAMSRIALVTSAAHMPRALLAFSREGIACVPAPTNYRSDARQPAATDFLPRFESLQDVFLALREYLGIVLYTIRR
jgi:uncharacterized SAM-binding protein YcdF (DUF218 family)